MLLMLELSAPQYSTCCPVNKKRQVECRPALPLAEEQDGRSVSLFRNIVTAEDRQESMQNCEAMNGRDNDELLSEHLLHVVLLLAYYSTFQMGVTCSFEMS
jgi:hypothetical protein